MKSFLWMDFSDEAHVKWTILQMVGYLVMYIVIYKALRKVLGCVPEYACRIVTFVHGLIAAYCALCYVVLPSLGLVEVPTIPYMFILTHSMGYFSFDLFWCFYHGETPVMKFHHMLTVTGLFYFSFKASKQFYIVYALGLTEITNPFLQVRWFLKYYGMREGLLFKVIETMLIGLFFFIRVGVLTVYLYMAWFNEALGFTADDLAFTTLGVLTGYALSIQMFNYIRYQMKKNQKKKLEQQHQLKSD